MDLLVTIALIFLLSIPLGLAGAWMVQRGGNAFSDITRGHQPDPWPLGVQEEDIDHRWGARPNDARAAVSETVRDAAIEDDQPRVPIAPVRPAVRRTG